MTTTAKAWLAVGALILAIGALLSWQRQQTALLNTEVGVLRARANEVPRLLDDQARLQASRLPDEELAALREDRAALDRLRTELESLKKSAKAAAPQPQPDKATDQNPPLNSSEWKHAGRATPAATLETLLWARLHGNVDVIASGLAFEDESARALAHSLMASLPPAMGAHHNSPERLIALLAAKDADHGSYDSMRILEEWKLGEEALTLRSMRKQQPDVTDAIILRSQLHTRNGEEQSKALLMQRSFDGWKLVVPASVVETYAERLKEAVAP